MFSEPRLEIEGNKEKFSVYLCKTKKTIIILLRTSGRDCDLGIEPFSYLGGIIKQLFRADCHG